MDFELHSPQKEAYGKDDMKAIDAQRMARFIAWGPVVFQVSRIMVKWGIFQLLSDHKEGLTIQQVAADKHITVYAAQCLLESSLTARTVYLSEGNFFVSKVGRFLMDDAMNISDMDFVQDVNYQGLFSLEQALLSGKPEGLKVFGSWPTIYEGLSQLPPQVQKSWFGFDHFYSDNSFQEALQIVFADKPKTLLDVGGNTGRWATQCVGFNAQVQVTVMDLPQQIQMMHKATASLPGANRISGYPANLLDASVAFPTGFDALWMSQFLDCFSAEQVISVLSRAARSMGPDSRLYIMETLWDRQRFETASFCLAQTSLYFTAMANGNSKMFYSGDLEQYIKEAGLKVVTTHDGIGLGHSIVVCSL